MTSPSGPRSDPGSHPFLAGGGEMGALMRRHDWSTSPVGDPAAWPQSLRAVIALMINSRYPMFVAWGADLAFLYNDAYVPIFGAKHPHTLGLPFKDVWSEIWDDISPLIDRALAGEATFSEDLHLVMERNGFPEDTWYSFSYSPVRDESGAVAGMFCACTETTQAVLSSRRRDALLRLDARLRTVADTAGLSFAASEILGEVLGVARVGYGEIDAAAGTISIERNWYAEGFDDLAGIHRFETYGSYVDELRRGVPVAIADVARDPRTANNTDAFGALGIRANLDVPVVEDGQTVGQIFVHSATPRVWTEDEVAFVQDFAERTRAAIARRGAEAALRESEERLRLAIDHAEIGFWDVDEKRQLLHWPPIVKAMFGISPDVPVTVQHFYDGLHRDDVAATADAYAAAVDPARRAVYDVEYRTIGAEDGAVRWIAAKGRGVFDDQGVCLRAVGTARDVTRRKAMEAELMTLNQTLERRVAEMSADLDRVWHNASDIFVVIDHDGRFRRINPATTRLLGWTEAEMIGHELFEFIIPQDEIPTQAALAQAREEALPTFENRYRTKDGGERTISWLAAREGPVIYAYGRDITESRTREKALQTAQEALRQSQKMEAMGQLTGGVAHDFNNLLTPIVGALDMLQRRGVGTERERRLIDGAMQSADRARTLVQRLLAFARRQPLKPVAIDVGRMVQEMGGLIESTSGPRIEVRIDAPEGLPAALADPNQLEMALLNLAVNARDAMPAGGRLDISVRMHASAAELPNPLIEGEYLRLSVADTGHGMDRATAARAIEPFFSTKGIGQGTGLGLSMVHGLTLQSGGHLTIDSAPGKGTRIDLWLPTTTMAPSSVASASTDLGSRQGSVLLVDDEDLVRASTADMLLELGYDVTEAMSAEAALALVEDGLRPDILITDHLMPGLSGTQLAGKVRELMPATRVLIISGYADIAGIPSDQARLTKPFRGDELAAALMDSGDLETGKER